MMASTAPPLTLTLPFPFLLGMAILVVTGCGQAQTAPDANDAQPVELRAATTRSFRDTVAVTGSVRAVRHALVAARVPGPLERIPVDEGDAVRADETVLFAVDAANLRRALRIAERNEAVAEAALAASRADRDRVAAELNLARIDNARFHRLYENDQAVTRRAVEQQDARLAQATAAQAAAVAAVDLAAEKAAQAELAREIAARRLDDAEVVAPLTGVVSARLLEPGETVAPGLPVLRLDDPTELEATVFLPEAYYDRVEVDVTGLELHGADGRYFGTHPVTHRAPTVDARLRTFAVRCRIPEPPAGLMPGREVRATVVLAVREGTAIPADAVLDRGEQRVCFTVADGTATRHEVEPGLRDGSWLEITAGLSAGARVVVAGQDYLENGDAVRVMDDDR